MGKLSKGHRTILFKGKAAKEEINVGPYSRRLAEKWVKVIKGIKFCNLVMLSLSASLMKHLNSIGVEC